MRQKISTEAALNVFEERILPIIVITSNNCWITPLTDNGNGYVYLHLREFRRRIGIHVISFLAFLGEMKENYFILHKCDNPSCCNPDHLFSGTQFDNMRDMDDKGRRGVWHPSGNLNPSKREDVRKELSKKAKSRKRNNRGQFERQTES